MFPDVDEFVNRSIYIGNALQFRALLHEAQRQLLEKDVPYVYRVVSLIFDQVKKQQLKVFDGVRANTTTQYPRNTFMKPEFLEMDSLALAIGMEPGTADQ